MGKPRRVVACSATGVGRSRVSRLERAWPTHLGWNLIIGLLLSSSRNASANAKGDYGVVNWQVEDGLPQNTVKEILQTRDGYLWLGTYNGLARFDGLKFATFNTANTPAMRSEDIAALFEDSRSRLWVGTEYGLLRYELGRLAPCPEAEAFASAHVMDIRELPDQSLVVATDQGIFRRTNGAFQELPIPGAAWPTRRSWVAVDPHGQLWIAQRAALYTWEAGQLTLQTRLDAEVSFMLADVDGTIWCILNDTRLVHVVRGVAQPHLLENAGNLRGLTRTRNGDFWISTDHGLVRERAGAILRLTTQDGLPNEKLELVFEDVEGNLWVGTADDGLVRLREKRVETYSTEDGLTSDDTISVLGDPDGRVWVGTFDGGLNVLEAGKWRAVRPPGLPESVQHVISLCRTRDGALWFGTYGRGAFRWQDAGPVQAEGNDVERIARALLEDRRGGIWIGTSKEGVEYFQESGVKWFNASNGLSINFVTAIAQDRANDVWIGTEDGLNRVSGERVTRYFKRDGLGVNLVNALYVDEAGDLWIGTMGGGLTRYRDGRFATVTSAQGLSNDRITQILEDDDGVLWLGTQSGIFRVRKGDLNAVLDHRRNSVDCVTYTKADGLRHPSYVGGFQPTCMKSSDGRLWFCGPGGVTVIDPKKLKTDSPPPPLYIESVIVDGENVFDQTREAERAGGAATPGGRPAIAGIGPELPVFRVAAGARRLEFNYTALNFSAPNRVLFR